MAEAERVCDLLDREPSTGVVGEPLDHDLLEQQIVYELLERDRLAAPARPRDPPEGARPGVAARERGQLQQLPVELQPGSDHALPA